MPAPKPSGNAAKLGLRYEANVGKQLARFVTTDKFIGLEHNPWFLFTDKFGQANCSPDFLLFMSDRAVIVEVKLTWVPIAMQKLLELYCPVVSRALQCPVMPLVICKNLAPNAPQPQQNLVAALTTPHKLLHWPQIGLMPWQ